MLAADHAAHTVALAFKLEDGPLRPADLYPRLSGQHAEGRELFNTRSRQRLQVGRLARMHADSMEDIEEAGAATSSPCSARMPVGRHVRQAGP